MNKDRSEFFLVQKVWVDQFANDSHFISLFYGNTKIFKRYHRCIFIYKCVNGLINFDFDLIKNINIHNHNTRRSNDLHLPKVNTNKGKQWPLSILTTWIKELKTLVQYKTLRLI